MKKTLSLLTLATLLVSFGATAADLNIINNVRGAQSVLVKTTNADGSPKNTQCIPQGNMGFLPDYVKGSSYRIKATLFNGMCSGGIVNEFENGFTVQDDSNVIVEVTDYQMNIH